MKKIEFEINKEILDTIQVCCNLNPKEMEKRWYEISRSLPKSNSPCGWQYDRNSGAVKCASLKGRWHYIFIS